MLSNFIDASQHPLNLLVARSIKISTHINLNTGSRSLTLSGPKNCNVSGKFSDSWRGKYSVSQHLDMSQWMDSGACLHPCQSPPDPSAETIPMGGHLLPSPVDWGLMVVVHDRLNSQRQRLRFIWLCLANLEILTLCR